MSGVTFLPPGAEAAQREAGTEPGVTAVVTVTLWVGLVGSKGLRISYGVTHG